MGVHSLVVRGMSESAHLDQWSDDDGVDRAAPSAPRQSNQPSTEAETLVSALRVAATESLKLET